MTDPLRQQVLSAIGQQYQLEDEIGRGGMSVVYRARDLRLNRPVAVKVLPPELAYDPAVRTRFTREAQMAARLLHPHIVPIHDVGQREGLAYLVMALVTGGSVATLAAREPMPDFATVRRILSEVADALAHAHGHGIVHRDVKPDNILLEGEARRVLVADFGIARAMEGGRLTATGVAVGTPAYMSPEQATGEREIDGRSDIYSLGVVGYQLLAGHPPFTAGNSVALLLKHVTERPKPIAELRPDAPPALREAVERAMMKAPDARWPDAAAMRDALLSEVGRLEIRHPVRMKTPAAAPPVHARALVLEPPHLAGLTAEQRVDLRLWHGRVNLLDRVKAMRGYAWLTLGATALGIGGFVAGVTDVPPLVLSPIVPLYMMRKLVWRARSLRASGLRLRRVLLMPRARQVLGLPRPTRKRDPLEKLAPREVLEGPHGSTIRRAADDRAAILELLGKLSKADRALLPDVAATANALVERVVMLAQSLLRLDEDLGPSFVEELAAGDAEVGHAGQSLNGQRPATLLHQRRAALDDLVQRRATLERQLREAGVALGNLRLDLIRLRSSGIASSMNDLSTATQQARALERDIAAALDAAAELRRL